MDAKTISKKEIFKETGCIQRCIFSLVLSLAGAIGAFLIFCSEPSWTLAIGVISVIMFFIFAILAVKEIPMIAKISKEQYEIKISSILSIRFRYPYSAGDDRSKSLEFSKFRLTVDDYKAKEFKVGDNVLMVFVKGIKYPVVIKKWVK